MSELNAISQVTQIAQMTENKLAFTFEDEGEQTSRRQDQHRYRRHNYCCKCQFGSDPNDEDTIIERVRWHEKKTAKLQVCELVLPKLIERFGTLEELREKNKKNKEALYSQKKMQKYGNNQGWRGGRGGYGRGGYNQSFGGPMRGGYNNRGRGGFQPYQRGGRGGGFNRGGGHRGGYNQGGWNGNQGGNYGGNYNQGGNQGYENSGGWGPGGNNGGHDNSGFGGQWSGGPKNSSTAAATPGGFGGPQGAIKSDFAAPVTTPVGATDGYVDFSAD